MANSVDPDQTPHYAASDKGLHCLQRPVCSKTLGLLRVYKGLYVPILKVITVLIRSASVYFK